jgi:radical SAM superfamily enzyme YgiQ (UPF0313 family)
MGNPYRIQLVACAIERSTMAYPLGALCILTALRSDEKLASDIDARLSHYLADTHDPLAAAREIAASDCDVVGLSLYLYNRSWFDRFITEFRAIAPHVILFAGGPEAGAKADELLGMGLSFIVLGEGEETVVSVMRKLRDGKAPGGSGIKRLIGEHADPAYPADLSSLASPLLSGIADPSSYDGVLWEMTRGCPYHCAFCFESRGHRSVRMYPVERIERELDVLVSHDVEHVFVLDPTFNMHRERTVRMLTLLRDRAPESMHFTFEVRAELLDEQTASLFGQFHCSLQIGLQSSSSDILRAIGRSFKAEVFTRKIALLNKHGVVFGLDLIIGLPQDTLETFTKSLDFAIGCKPSNLDIFLLALLPGTKLADEAASLGLVHQTQSPYLLIESPGMDRLAIAEALRLKDACDRFYTAGQAAMWFHSACDGVRMRPSEVLLAFSDYLAEHPEERGNDIYAVQDSFIKSLYRSMGKEHLLPALLGYMELHQGIAHLQQTGESPVVNLCHDADTLAHLDHMDLEAFVETYPGVPEALPYWIFTEDGVLYVEPIEG